MQVVEEPCSLLFAQRFATQFPTAVRRPEQARILSLGWPGIETNRVYAKQSLHGITAAWWRSGRAAGAGHFPLACLVTRIARDRTRGPMRKRPVGRTASESPIRRGL